MIRHFTALAVDEDCDLLTIQVADLDKMRLEFPEVYEILFIDDGSTDRSLELLRNLQKNDSHVVVINFRKNFGQTAAMAAGFDYAQGDVIITMDADLQNDPADIPMLLEQFGPYDMVNGWRKNRQDSLSKKISSRIGNYVRNLLSDENINDTGCSLKVMRADLLKKIKMYRGLHRFLPTLMRIEGAKVIELPVNHRHRQFGVSKYTNLRRGVEGFQDLMAVRWMMKRYVRIDGELS
jgi:dolichol-phosphate mannosyltransferase